MAEDTSPESVISSDGLGNSENNDRGKNSLVDTEFDSTFGTKTWREDTCLIVEGKQLHVSSCVLSLLSPVFTRMLEDKMGPDGPPLEIELGGKTYDDVLEFLKCIYPNLMKRVTLENVFVVLPLAEDFGVGQLKASCENVLLENTGDFTETIDICKYLYKAVTFSLTDLQRACIEVASRKKFADLIESEKEFPLPAEVKLEIQSNMMEVVERRMSRLNHAECSECSQHEKTIKTVRLNQLLLGDIQPSKFKNPRVGYLEYTVDSLETPMVQNGPQAVVHGINWHIRITSSYTDAVGTFLVAKPLGEPFDWSCKVYGIMYVHNYKNGKDAISKPFNGVQVYTSSKPTRGFSNIVPVRTLKDTNAGFMNDGKIRVELYYVVGEPTFNLEE